MQIERERQPVAEGGKPHEKPGTERPEPKRSDADAEDKRDEELEESFPASDPPASTQP